MFISKTNVCSVKQKVNFTRVLFNADDDESQFKIYEETMDASNHSEYNVNFSGKNRVHGEESECYEITFSDCPLRIYEREGKTHPKNHLQIP